MANVKFKMCWRCQQTKTNPLDKNYIRPDQEVCASCDREMLIKFIEAQGFTLDGIRNIYKNKVGNL